MISQASPIRIPDAVEDKLLEVRVARDRARLATVGAIGLLTLLVAMCLAMLVDWTFTLFDPFWRSVLTAVALGLTITTLVAAGFLLWWRGRRLTQVAQEVDRAVPPIEERWWTVAELAAAPLEQQRAVHTGMINRLNQESVLCERHVSADEVVSLRSLLIAVIAICAVVLGLLVACVIDWQQTMVLAKRFWAPTANISATRLEVPAGDIVAARGEPLLLEAKRQGRPAPEATLFLRQGDESEAELIPLSATGPEENRFVHRIKAADSSLSYRVRAGDGQSRWVGVTIADRPELAAARFRAVPPAYTGREPVDLLELPGRVSVVEGSQLEVSLLPRGEVDSVAFQLDDENRQPLSEDIDGWYRYRTQLQKNVTLTALLTESHGLTNKRPPVCRIEVYRDQPPSVEVASPTNDMAARPDDEIDIAFTASDDFGIAKAELVVYGDDGEDSELQVFDIPLGEQAGASTINRSVPLDLSQFDLADGQSISYAVRVYDTRQSTSMSQPGGDNAPPDSELQQTPSTPAALAESSAADSPVEQSAANVPPSSRTGAAPKATTPDQSSQSTATPVAGNTTTPSAPSSSSPPPASTTSDGANQTSQPKTADAASSKPSNKPTPPSLSPSVSAAESATAEKNAATSKPPTASKEVPNGSTASASNSSNKSLPPGDTNGANDSLQTGAPRPPDNMQRRTLDVGQSASSGRMRLNIDQWAGSFAARQREKLEMSISPKLEKLDEALARAENRLQEVLQALEQNVDWSGSQDHILGKSEEDLSEAIQIVADLNTKSAGTPYAFVGLQLTEITDSHVEPALDSVWIARQADANPKRQPPVESAWQQVGRARQRLKQLVTQYERIRREHHLTDAIENIKTMYQAFIEDSFALLDQQKSPINNYQRRMAEFELDEEYLKRLEEVLKMRQKLIAEFARILAEDPRLLRRFVDSINSQSESLRDQLTLLTLRQQELDEELRTWVQLPEKVRDRAAAALIQKRLQKSINISEKSAQLQEQFHTWTPLDLGVQDGDLQAVADQLAKVAADARKLEATAAAWRAESDKPPGEDESNENDPHEEKPAEEPGFQRASLSSVTAEGRQLYEQLQTLDQRLLELSGKGNDPDLASFLVRRLAETRELIALTSGWVYQIEQLEQGNYPGAAAVEQHQLAEETNELTANLADLEQQLTGILGREDDTLPPEIAELSRSLLSTLDRDIAGSQLGAVFSLRRTKLEAAAKRTHDAAEGFVRAEELFDELFKKVIDEADKLPVQDPIADLLDDPTLDELLALLENEQALAAALGIPARPSNLQTIGDWIRRGSGGGGIGSGMVMSQLNSGQRMLNRVGQRTINRLEEETAKASTRRGVRRIDEWNVLASELENKLLQSRGQLPPERYRRAIDQYFEELSRQSADDETQAP